MIYPINLKTLYMTHCGISEVPAEFQEWCLYSLVAATVGDRVGYRYVPEAVTIPAIYVFLVGPSGYGKNEAIKDVRKYASAIDTISIFEGRVSAPALMRKIGEAQEGRSASGQVVKLWFVTPELGNSIGEGPKSMDIVKQATELFSMGGKAIVAKDSTLSFGSSEVVTPCLNWLGGTTVKWLKRSVSRDDIEAGFGSRVFMIYKEPDFSAPRIPRPIIPPNYWQLRDEILARLQLLARIVGEFRMTQGALQVEDEWYMNRPAPHDEILHAWWKRERELCLKMAMILSLCARDDLVITDEHMAGAQEVVQRAGRGLELLITSAGLGDDRTGMEIIASTIKVAEVIPHEKIARVGIRNGLVAGRLTEVLRSLVESGMIVALDKAGKRMDGHWRGAFYAWSAKRVRMPQQLSGVKAVDPAEDDAHGRIDVDDVEHAG